MILCPNCQAPNPDAFQFCGRCGKPLHEEPEEEATKAEQVPSWLRDLGEGVGVPAGPVARTALPGALAESVPPWLAPPDAAATGEAEAELPPWLAMEDAAKPEPSGPELPPWLADQAAAAPAPQVRPETGAGLPPWLASEQPPPAQIPSAAPPEQGLPPWLAEEAPSEPVSPHEPTGGEALPPWLAEEGPAEEAPVEPVAEEAPVGEEEALPAWLTEEAPVEPLAEEMSAEEEALPAWPAEDIGLRPVRPEEPEEAQVEPVAEEMPAEEEALPAWLAEEAPVEPLAEGAPPEEEALPAWLAEEAPVEPAAEEAPAEEEAPPAWLAEEVPVEPVAEEMPAEGEALPAWLAEEAPVEPLAEEEALPPWLAEEAPVEEVPVEEAPVEPLAEEVPAEAVAPDVEVPSWLGGLEEEFPSWLSTEGPEGEPAEGVAPPWLAEEPAVEIPEETPLPPLLAEDQTLEEPVSAELPPEEAAAEVLPEEQPVPLWLAEELPGEAVPEEQAVLPSLVEEVPPEAVVEEAVPPWPAEDQIAELVEEMPVSEELESRALPVAPEEEAALPEWARSLKPAEEEAVPAQAPTPFLDGVELPDWLRVEERPTEVEPVEAPAGAMDWLDRLAAEEPVEEVPSLAAVERMPRSMLSGLSLARQQAADLFAALMVSPEPEPKPPAVLAPSFLGQAVRWLSGRWPMLALAFVIAFMMFRGVPLPRPTIPAGRNEQAFRVIESSVSQGPQGSPHAVLMAFDWDVQRTAEMKPWALALTRHLINRDAQIIAVSTTFHGSQLAQEIIDTAVSQSEVSGYTYGESYLNLGIRTGGEGALRLLGAQPLAWTFPQDFRYGRFSDQYPLMQQARTLSDVSLLLVLVGEEDRALSWLEQVRSRYPDIPCVLVVPVELEPLMQPYLRARAVAPDAVLTGLDAALEYEVYLMRNEGIVLNRDLPLEPRVNLLAVAQLALVAIIVVGNVANLGHWLNSLRQALSRS